MNNNKILFLTLVHPDFLPPVYAFAQSLRDVNYTIQILTFDSLVPSEFELGNNINIEVVGNHHNAGFLRRISLRNKFRKRAQALMVEDTTAIISFCPFSYLCGLRIRSSTRLIYAALEIANFDFRQFARSPLSSYRNLRALQQVGKADLVATPSIPRSAWLAGRCNLNVMPETILNTSYISATETPAEGKLFEQLVPPDFINKKIILYTGAVNEVQNILELLHAFDDLNNDHCCLIVTGMKNNDYCNKIRSFSETCKTANKILLLPYVTRDEMLCLQSHAHIGVCLSQAKVNNIESQMIAPNKVGEYTAKGLYVLAINNEYMRILELQGIASLSATTNVTDLSSAICKALDALSDDCYKTRIKSFVENYFCMQAQVQPIVKFLKCS